MLNNDNHQQQTSAIRRLQVLQNQLLKSSLYTQKIDESLVIRLLEPTDYHKGFLHVLSQLTNVGDITEQQFLKRYEELLSTRDTYFVFVIEDLDKQQIVACATLIVELKFIHSCGAVGHIEDVVVSDQYRSKNLGVKLIEMCKTVSKERSCYKVILDCTEKVVPFYERCQFDKKGVLMRHDIDH